MPINDASVLFAADKTNINTNTTTTKTTTPPTTSAAASHTLKPGTQLELHLPNPGSTSSATSQTKFNDNALFKHQCQKWQQCFDFERMLKQIRMCEKQHYLRGGGKDDTSTVTSSGNGSSAAAGGGSGNNSNGKNLPSPSSSSISPTKSSSSSSNLSSGTAANASSSPTAAAVSPSGESKCSRKLRQVKPLNGNDMHYYGIVPKQAALGVIICNFCLRISTKAGFNNHMMVHHPTIWNNVSSKVIASTNSGDASTYNLHTHDNSQDGVREVAAAAGTSGAPTPSDIIGSPSDLSGTMSTCSNASSTSSMSSTYVTKHKSSKNGSIAGSSSSSSSGSGGRSRSKSKHHHSSSSTSSTSVEVSQTSSKSSKKSLSAVVSAAASSTANLHTVIAAKDNNATHGGSNSCSNSSSSSGVAKAIPDSMQSLAVYTSSSSNSSCSLPPTPRMISSVSGSGGVDGSSTLLAPRDEASYSPATLATLNEGTKEKLSSDVSQGAPATGSVSTAKKKAHSPPFLGQGQEAVDSSSSSSEFDQSSSAVAASASKSSKHAAFASNAKVEKDIGHRSGVSMGASTLKKPPICEKDLKMYNTHISELDQAVSSITGCADSRLMSGSNANESVQQTQMAESSTSLGNKSQSIVPPSANITQIPVGANTTAFAASTSATTQAATMQACEEAIPHNSSDDNSILTLEDMLDSKFINDILNTADPEMHFDENELDSTTQQPYMQQQQQQQPASKRMRYEDSVALAQQQQHPTNDYAVYQQQPQYVQMCKYDNNNTIDDVKLYNAEQQLPMDAQYQTQLSKLLQQQQQDDNQHQITTIDAMQLQQLLYQQQNLGNYSGSLDQQHSQQQQQQYGDTNLLDAKQIIDFCGEDGSIAKGAHAGVYGQQSCHGDMYANQFQVFNVPSLIDDDENTNGAASVDVLMPSMVDVLPTNEEQQHLIYEITANNQVAVLSQQRQQQMLAEFLTQANYENVTNVTNLPTTHDATSQQQQQQAQMHGAGFMTLEDDESSELLDFDFTHIETVRSLSTNTTATIDSKASKVECSNSSSSSSSSSNNSTNNPKYHDDYYLNVFIYAGIPKPLAINNFGLIKLPQAVATTFRKNLLTTRKANNSPISLNSSLNGLAGGGNAMSVMRLANVGVGSGSSSVGKNPPSYFTSLSSGGSGGNEFSIGSITISNTPTLQQQQQQNSGSALEITLNANSNSPSTTTVAGTTTQHKGRTKGAGGVNATITATPSQSATSSGIGITSKGKANTLGMATATMAGTGIGTVTTQTTMARSMGRQSIPVQQAKTIFVSSTPSGTSNERVKCIKRSLIARMDSTKKSTSTLLAKHIAEILSSGGSTSTNKQHQHTSTSTAVDGLTESETVGCTEQQQHQLPPLRQTRVKHFYEHRKKLYSLARQKQQQQQLLNKQLLLRTRPPSDCSSGSVSSGSASSGSSNSNGFKIKSSSNNNAINNNSSNNNNNNSTPSSSSSNNNDIMRVFV